MVCSVSGAGESARPRELRAEVRPLVDARGEAAARADSSAAGRFGVLLRRVGVLSAAPARDRAGGSSLARDVRAAEDRPPVDRAAAAPFPGVRAEDAREPVLALEAMGTE